MEDMENYGYTLFRTIPFFVFAKSLAGLKIFFLRLLSC